MTADEPAFPPAAPPASRLAPGVRVRAWKHHFAPWDLAARVTLHEGVVLAAGRLVPAGPARPLTPEEVLLLDGAVQPDGPALEVLTTPALLREHFWSLDPAELPGGTAAAESKAWQGFVTDVQSFLRQVRAPVPPAHALLLTVRDAEAAPGLWEEGPGRALLERDLGAGATAGAPELSAALHVNLGDAPTALVFFNVPLAGMAALLRAEGLAAPPPDALALVRAFVQHFPRCPLVRLALEPGDGVLVPLAGIAHDFDARAATDLDVSLSLLPAPGN